MVSYETLLSVPSFHNHTSNSNPCTSTKKKRIRKRKHIPHSERSSEYVKHRNNRERNRVQAINTAFENLKKCIPSVCDDPKLSKVDILSNAINYIYNLDNMLMEEEKSTTVPIQSNDCQRKRSGRRGNGLQMLTNRMHFQGENEKSFCEPIGRHCGHYRLYGKENKSPFMEIVDNERVMEPERYPRPLNDSLGISMDNLINIPEWLSSTCM